MVSWMYDREDIIDSIQKLLSEGRHIQVCGPRKIGKTTILDNLANRIGNRFYYFNCETKVANSPDAIVNSMKRLFRTYTPLEAPKDSWKKVMYEVFEFLKRKNNDCVIIIDELSDSLNKMTEEERHDFLDILLWLPDEIGIQMIICGSIGFERILESYDKKHEIRAMFVPLFIKPFSEDIASGFIKECFSKNELSLPDNILSVISESIITCFGKDSLFPLFLKQFIDHVTHTILKSSDDWQMIITRAESVDEINVNLSQQQKSELDTAIKGVYDECLQQVVDVYNRKRTGGGPLQDLIGYIHLIEGDLTRTGTLSKNRTQLVTRILLMREITPAIISLFKDQGIDIILNNLSENYLLKHSGDNYISYLKFLGDVWSRLHPLEGELEERRD